MEPSGGGRGLWNNPRPAQSSRELQDLMRIRKDESRLACSQRKQINRNPKIYAPPLSSSPGRPARIHPPASTQRRSAESCRSGSSYERERFCPGPTRDLEREKRRLQNILATGEEEPESTKPPRTTSGGEPGAPEEIDRCQEVLNEIEERRQFLAEMAALGQEKQYVDIINTEISQRLRELELLNRTGRPTTGSAAAENQD
ncbi:UPF0193 protein EVG1 isoform X2 [Kryptolebias marmoratus]|uniref:UPF0193 protein EVG1 isoform X2 n=1 Tax=Kryptolebias marmoratus TaxID=37003 RepID=UPI0007F89F86|nr:UPF0193 protein EVG1 isoform X2 [Kryptolebias marmoratus]